MGTQAGSGSGAEEGGSGHFGAHRREAKNLRTAACDASVAAAARGPGNGSNLPATGGHNAPRTGRGLRPAGRVPAAAYQQRLEDEGERPDGLVATDLLASFLTEFRFDVHCAIAKGQAQMQLAAGTPTAIRRGGQSGGGLSLRQGRAQDQAQEQAQDQAPEQARDQAQEQGHGLEHGQDTELSGSLDSMAVFC